MKTLAAAGHTIVSPDDALIRRAQEGDAAAFDALVATRIDRCYRLALAILANDADAADATQEAFVSAWRQLPRLRDRASFDGWLNRIVANAARMGRRHRVRLREVQISPLVAGDPVAAPATGRRDPSAGFDPDTRLDPNARTVFDGIAETDAISRAFDRLRPEERALLALHHVDERPVAEIARSLGIPVGTVKWRLHAARRALERAMEAEA